MQKFYCETIDRTSSVLKGPIDPKNGFPTVHESPICEANSSFDAILIFQKRFPGNVDTVYSDYWENGELIEIL